VINCIKSRLKEYVSGKQEHKYFYNVKLVWLRGGLI